ncbi:uncharacterized protein LOC127750863 [Frankliniella occidentalis]|uniref:Uncharacterized protein LOC127750863 n=1 Tax=Frankliniella occidentalis TaxID=133901 RepID=A0A9C6X5E4_FRAOC|nr:uncharacterized protein LOC127750863 [Frankliniella occidentalis]
MLRENYSARINAPVVATRGNALLMVLEMAKQNSDTVKGFIDSANLVNSLFATPVLPTSKFLMDKLLRIDMGIEKHYYCPKCKHDFGIVQEATDLKCARCQPEEDTDDSMEEADKEKNEKVEHFVIFNLVTQLEIVLKKVFKSGVQLFKPSFALEREAGHFTDVYDGSVYKSFAKDFDTKEEVKVISLTVCTDGSPIFKSSALSIWPIFVMINELPPGPRFSNLLLGGLWFGKSQPNMKLFLTPFARKLTEMSYGFTININVETEWKMEAHLLGCCVDSGARGAVQFISTHGGYYSCNWCEIPGVYMFGAVRYPMMPERPHLRTCRNLLDNGIAFTAAVSARQRFPVDRLERAALFKGVKGVTPLAECDSFDPVDGFILEHAHCVYLGIVRNYASIWHSMLSKKGNDREDKLQLLNERLQSLRPPIEVRRLPRILEERIKWNAKESENFLLFYSIPSVQGLIQTKYLKHWNLLVQALHLLLRNDVTVHDCNVARTLLCHFCCDIHELYGEQELTFNCHLLTHLAEHVLRWGPLWAISGMAFEDGNGALKRKIKAAKGIPNQIHRNLWQECALDVIREEFSSIETKVFCDSLRSKQLLKKGVFTPSCNFMGKCVKFQPSPRESWLCTQISLDPKRCVEYKKIIKDKCVFTSASKKKSRTCNVVAELQDGSIVKIQKLLMEVNSHTGYATINHFQCESMYQFPEGVELPLNKQAVRRVVYEERDLQIVPVSNLKTVCVYSRFPHGTFVSPMPNICNLY